VWWRGEEGRGEEGEGRRERGEWTLDGEVELP
jgi:hypothetical protein